MTIRRILAATATIAVMLTAACTGDEAKPISGSTLRLIAGSEQEAVLNQLEVAASLDEQAKGIEEAVRFGRQARAEVVSAIVTAQESMSATSQRLSKTVVELVTKARDPLALPAGPQLPASVMDHAADLMPTRQA